MATVNTNPALKVALLKLKAETKFAHTREDIATAVKTVLGIDEKHPMFNTLVDKMAVKAGIQAQQSTYASEFVNVLQVVNLSTQLAKIRYIGKGNVAQESNKLADAIFAQWKRAGGKLTMASFKKVLGDYKFMVTGLKTIKTFTDACLKDAKKVSTVKQQVISDRIATQKVVTALPEGEELVDMIEKYLDEFNGTTSSFPTPEADKVGNPNDKSFDSEESFLDGVTEYKYAWEEDLAHHIGYADAESMLAATGIDDADWTLFQAFSDNFAPNYAEVAPTPAAPVKPEKKIKTMADFELVFANDAEKMEVFHKFQAFNGVLRGTTNWDGVAEVIHALGGAGKVFKFKKAHRVDSVPFVGIKDAPDGLYGVTDRKEKMPVESVPAKLLQWTCGELKYNKKFEKTINELRDSLKLTMDAYNNGTATTVTPLPAATAPQSFAEQVAQQKAQQAVQQQQALTEEDIKYMIGVLNRINRTNKMTQPADIQVGWDDITYYLKNVDPDSPYTIKTGFDMPVNNDDGVGITSVWYISEYDAVMLQDTDRKRYDVNVEGDFSCLKAVAIRIKESKTYYNFCQEMGRLIGQIK